jgi:hypothetical protein
MIIKPCVRAGYRQAAAYLQDKGENEKVRLVEISDPNAKNINEAFQCMWEVAYGTRAKKPLFHFSINPCLDERLTHKQAKYITDNYMKRCNLDPSQHQRVIVEHIKEGRQHFHVFVCRVNFKTGKCIDPGKYIIAAKRCAREMEKKFGLKSPVPRRVKRMQARIFREARQRKMGGRYHGLKALGRPTFNRKSGKPLPIAAPAIPAMSPSKQPAPAKPYMPVLKRKRGGKPNRPPFKPFRRAEWASMELLAWAWENGRADILAQFGIHLSPDYFEP